MRPRNTVKVRPLELKLDEQQAQDGVSFENGIGDFKADFNAWRYRTHTRTHTHTHTHTFDICCLFPNCSSSNGRVMSVLKASIGTPHHRLRDSIVHFHVTVWSSNSTYGRRKTGTFVNSAVNIAPGDKRIALKN